MSEPGDQLRNSEDVVESFFRSEIDRGSVPMSGELLDEEGTPLLGVAVAILRKNGTLSILDAGCGTAHAVWEVKDQLLFRTGNSNNQGEVTAIGVNNKDFSQESSEAAVRQATSNGTIQYIVSDIETVPIPLASQDLLWSYEVLFHNPNSKVAAIIRHLLPMLKPKGRLYFNITPKQREDLEISSTIDQAKQNGMFVFEYEKEKSGEKRTFIMLRNDAQNENSSIQ